MADAHRRRFDAIAVWKFDRFARSVSHLLRALDTFRVLGIEFVSLSESLDTATPAGRMVFTVLGAVTELERSLIAERVRAGLRNARAKGKQLAQDCRGCCQGRAPTRTGSAGRRSQARWGLESALLIASPYRVPKFRKRILEPRSHWMPRRSLLIQPIHYCRFAYSALACFRMEIPGSASFQRVRKSWCVLWRCRLASHGLCRCGDADSRSLRRIRRRVAVLRASSRVTSSRCCLQPRRALAQFGRRRPTNLHSYRTTAREDGVLGRARPADVG